MSNGTYDWEGLAYLFATGLVGVAIEWLRRRVMSTVPPPKDATEEEEK
jgi:hypothetical protein